MRVRLRSIADSSRKRRNSATSVQRSLKGRILQWTAPALSLGNRAVSASHTIAVIPPDQSEGPFKGSASDLGPAGLNVRNLSSDTKKPPFLCRDPFQTFVTGVTRSAHHRRDSTEGSRPSPSLSPGTDSLLTAHLKPMLPTSAASASDAADSKRYVLLPAWEREPCPNPFFATMY